MPTIVTIKSTARAVVISERIDDRERHENGRDVVQPDVEEYFIVHAGQSLRVIDAPIVEVVTPALPVIETQEVQLVTRTEEQA